MRAPNQGSIPEATKPPQPLPRGPSLSPPGGGLGDFARKTLVALLLTVLVVVVTALCYSGLRILLLTFAGVLLAVFLSALADLVKKFTGLPHVGSLAIVVVAVLGMVTGIVWLLANRLAMQTQELSKRLPESLENLRAYLISFPWGRLLLEHEPTAGDVLAQAANFFDIRGLITGVTGLIIAAVVIVFVGIFAAAEPDLYRAGFLHLIPPASRRRAGEAFDVLGHNLRWWLVGQVILMIVMWLTTTIGLWVIGVPLALSLGVIAGILELIPYIGPWISAVPAVLIAMMVGPSTLVLTILLYLALHIVEGYFLLPLIQRGVVLLPPAVTLVAQILLGEVLGVIGFFVAAPLTLCVVVLLKMLYVEDTLGDESVEVPGEPEAEQKKLDAAT